ncbi:2-isopropylmalate synthase [Selenomonas sp. oral taxon 137 str. F0430]|jgi:2-isopropylmalate synthase|uniref:2-isopropylmalate synthase n=1 Tax=unclassified Selenomonas TaxID=2637378 RepID=UPI0001EB29DE|nr:MULTISPECIES: 2-isopropylmalate synthase [unclassified Selenomonas]EFR40721.1 2-isopropylmalate synthase [Selenomonas sp. oral taxon 137 str. F0430]EJP31500.1 putative 2-isopropylmalate synthase [Selenomonas sp. FOBRC9]
MNYTKYAKGYYMPPEISLDWLKKDAPDHAPVWCSVDLRDGNQSLMIPMSLDEKLAFFNLLVRVGFKEIEVGFPAASETEYEFLRRLVEDDLIPDDVTVQVLTQAREHIIRRTFDALRGVKNAIVHVYNSTSVAQREQVFQKSKEEILEIAVEGAELLKKLTEEAGANYRFEYSPESFTGTEPEYALEVCNAVLDVWQPTPERKAIINLPVTVQMSMPHVYGMQVAYVGAHLKYRDAVVLSLHPHNDRGCGVADAEMGLLAGADRLEGTLFGNGERTGNVDIITVAMNMCALGVDPQLDFSNLPHLVEVYERVTRMQVSPRQPYAGSLVFAAFSGSHQDAIAKGMKHWEEQKPEKWSLPYLYIDPKDVGRTYDGDVIRINSQSGKGGVAYIMEQQYGVVMPKQMREDFGYRVKSASDNRHKELQPDEIYKVFADTYVNLPFPYELVDFLLKKLPDGTRVGDVHLKVDGEERTYEARGNGRLDAISNALQQNLELSYTNLTYSEHALEIGQNSRAISYISITGADGKVHWGVGLDTDIITSSVLALFSAVNRMKAGH